MATWPRSVSWHRLAGWALGPPVGQETFPPYFTPACVSSVRPCEHEHRTDAEIAADVKRERNRRAEERKRKNRERARRR